MQIVNRKKYRIRQIICAILGICVSLLVCCVMMQRQEMLQAMQLVKAQEELTEEVFRFHVLANSDSEEDQQLKIKVRDGLLSYMKGKISETEKASADTMKLWAFENLEQLQEKALGVIRREGYDYSVNVCIRNCYFPDRRYGNVLFPKGIYEALRVEIGSGHGKNWWCALYPALCFMDAVCPVVNDTGQQELVQILSEETCETIFEDSDKIVRKSFFYELLKDKTTEETEDGR